MKHGVNVNLNFWRACVDEHVVSGLYDTEAFVCDPKALTLGADDIRVVGDVTGASLLHLQCHFGLDTLSWARLGATATGLDFSEPAIDAARSLAWRCGLAVRFDRACVQDLSTERAYGDFDIAVASYGVLEWIENLARYFSGVRHCLRPGGSLYVAEVHPVAKWFLDRQVDPQAPYHRRPVFERGVSYATGSMVTPSVHVWWHSLGDIVTAITQSGFRLQLLEEHDSSSYRFHRNLSALPDGRWVWPKVPSRSPLVCLLRAEAM